VIQALLVFISSVSNRRSFSIKALSELLHQWYKYAQIKTESCSSLAAKALAILEPLMADEIDTSNTK